MSLEKSFGLTDVDCSNANTTSDNASFISSSRENDSVKESSSSCNSRNSSSLIMPAPSKRADSIEYPADAPACKECTGIPRSLFDDLRHATDFLNSVKDDAVSNYDGTYRDAIDWVQRAALQLGNALIAQHAGDDHE